MTHPFLHARQQPEKTAAIFVPSGLSLSYGKLEEGANQAAWLLRSCGLAPGDGVVFCIENSPAFLCSAGIFSGQHSATKIRESGKRWWNRLAKQPM